MVKRIFPLAIVLYLMLFVTGCKQVMLDPEVDLLQMGTVALLEFDNLTSDLGIAREATVLLADELSKIEGLALLRPVLGDNRYSSRAAQEGRIQKIATDLGADTLLSGAVTYYFEDVYLEPPKRVLIDKNKELYKWQARQESSVEVVLSMQLLSKTAGPLLPPGNRQSQQTEKHRFALAGGQRIPAAFYHPPQRRQKAAACIKTGSAAECHQKVGQFLSAPLYLYLVGQMEE